MDIVTWFERLNDEIIKIYNGTSTIQDEYRRERVFIARAQAHITSKWTVSDISVYRHLPELEVYYDDDAIFRLVHVLTDELSERMYLAIGICAASGMFGYGIDAKRPDERTGLPYTIDTTPFKERTLKELEANLPNDFSKMIIAQMKSFGGQLDALQGKTNETQAAANLAAKNSAAAKRTAENIAQDVAGLPEAIAEAKAAAAGAKVAAEGARTGVSFLVHDRKETQARNSERGKASRQKAVSGNAEIERAKCDVETALKRVADDPDVRAGKHGAVIAACRRVCKRFATLTDAKKNAPTYLPLTKADGKPLTPKTLARYYRKRREGKRGKK